MKIKSGYNLDKIWIKLIYKDMDGTNVTRIQFSAESLTLTIELSETNKDNYGLQNGVLEE